MSGTRWVFDPETGLPREVESRKLDRSGGLPMRRMTALDREASERQRGRAGLWAGSGNSYFDHSRGMRTIDPSEYELELGMTGRQAVAWCTPLRENGKGRVVV